MLTIRHPEVRSLISDFPGGLMPIRLDEGKPLSLIVKIQKEAILAAKLNGGFALYLPQLPSRTVKITALISAFFDDKDEPLAIRTPFYANDDHSSNLLEILEYKEVDIYFFDEHNYEWMSFKTTMLDGGSCLMTDEDVYLPSYNSELSKSIHQALVSWFGQRTPEDDARAIQAMFKSELFRSDIVIVDTTPEMNSYLGSTGIRHDMLTRTDPGYFQERDISACLLRAFAPECIMMNLRRKDTFKEILDHLVLTDTVAILIQAKDSPTTEASINRHLDRKRRATRKQIEDAISQILGAARYLSRELTADLVVGGEEIKISIGQRRVIGLAIVKELFDDDGDTYAAECAKLSGLSGGGMVMDYSSFHSFTHHYRTEARFTEALECIIARFKSGGWFFVKDAVFQKVIDWTEGKQ